MAFSAQMGYFMRVIKYVAVKKVKLMRKLTMLRVGNTHDKPLQLMTPQSALCRRNPSTQKISREYILPSQSLG